MDGVLALDTIKSFKEIMSPEDYAEFLKSEDSAKLRAFPEVEEFMKGMDKEFQKESEKEEKEEEHEKGESKEEEKKEEEKEKAVTPEMLKSLQDTMDSKFGEVAKLLKALGSDDKIEELQKSVNAVTEIVEKIAGMPLGTKAIKTAAGANFFEKAFGGPKEDENGKKILSVTANKEEVLKSLEDGMKKAVDADLIKSYEGSIIRYNAGGGTIDQAVAIDLFETANIRLVK